MTKRYFDLRAGYADALAAVEERLAVQFPGCPLTSRLKTLDSVRAKLQRHRPRLSTMQDIAGCRLIVPELETQDRAVAVVLSTFAGARVYDLRVGPHSGYRAVHVIVEALGLPVEVQVRTEIQEMWALVSEKLKDQYGDEVKYGGGPSRVRRQLDGLSERAWEVEQGTFRGREYVPGGRSRSAELPVTLMRKLFVGFLRAVVVDLATLDDVE